MRRDWLAYLLMLGILGVLALIFLSCSSKYGGECHASAKYVKAEDCECECACHEGISVGESEVAE